MDNIPNLCMGCMNELETDGSCGYCGYIPDSPWLKSYLPPETVLDERYLIGKVLSYNGESASYIGYDTATASKVVVHEYMPDALCMRNSKSPKILVKADALTKYKTYMTEFAELNKSLSRMRTLSQIVPAIDMFSENNTMYAVTKYVEGISLKKFLQGNGNKLSWAHVKKLFPPVFTTLSLVHNSGIVHGGICPDNIIITPKGEVKLIGFSISAVRNENSDLNYELFAGYAAPEQYSKGSWQGTWTDVYAIAAVLYRILTGVVPQNAQLRRDADMLVDLSQMNVDIPQNVARVIMQALRVNPETRIQTITELVTKLFEQPELVEHQKGATQTIAVERSKPVPVSDEFDDDDEDDEIEQGEKKNMVPTIVGIIILVLLVAVGLFALAQMFTGSDGDQSTPVQRGTSSVSSVTVSSVSTTGESSSSADSSSQEPYYGTGSIMNNLVGYDYESVRDTIEQDFTVTVKYKKSSKYEAGVIMKQSIPAETEYDPTLKNKLKIVVSEGSGGESSDVDSGSDLSSDSSSYQTTVSVPDFTGMTADEYGQTLSYLGISYALSYVSSDLAQSGYVLDTSTPVGENFDTASGEILTVTVAS